MMFYDHGKIQISTPKNNENILILNAARYKTARMYVSMFRINSETTDSISKILSVLNSLILQE
jgi:hypothetical protein